MRRGLEPLKVPKAVSQGISYTGRDTSLASKHYRAIWFPLSRKSIRKNMCPNVSRDSTSLPESACPSTHSLSFVGLSHEIIKS